MFKVLEFVDQSIEGRMSEFSLFRMSSFVSIFRDKPETFNLFELTDNKT